MTTRIQTLFVLTALMALGCQPIVGMTDDGGSAGDGGSVADAGGPAVDAGADGGGADGFTVTQYNSSLNPGFFTYPGYSLSGSTYSCPGSGMAGYNPLQINLYVPNLADGGTVPLLLFFPGTYDDLDLSELTTGISEALCLRAAQLGFAAATLAYDSDDGLIPMFYPDRMDAKERCAFDSDISSSTRPLVTDNSALAQLCGNMGPLGASNTRIDCTQGIVTSGHSQGGMMALLAKNYEPRVNAAYTLGTGAFYPGPNPGDFVSAMYATLFPYLADPAVVLAQQGSLGNPDSGTYTFPATLGSANYRVLPSSRIRAEVGDVDPYFADPDAGAPTVGMIALRLNNVTGTTCAPGSPGECATDAGNGSGWFIVGSSELSPCSPATACTAVPPASHAGHCFFSTGNSVGCVDNSGLTEAWDPDPAYFGHGLTGGWTLDANLQWLKAQR